MVATRGSTGGRHAITLVAISPSSHALALELDVHPHQRRLVASVEKSLADAQAHREALFRLAFAGDEAIGYVLVFPFDSTRGRMVNIVRLMIDRRFQGRGLGRRLLETTLRWIVSFEPTVDVVRVSTLPENDAALGLYLRSGFVREGIEEGEVALYLSGEPLHACRERR